MIKVIISTWDVLILLPLKDGYLTTGFIKTQISVTFRKSHFGKALGWRKAQLKRAKET